MTVRGNRTSAAVVALALAATAVLTGCDVGMGTGTAAGGGTRAAPPPVREGDAAQHLPGALLEQRPDWQPCEGGGWTCAEVKVPLDYEAPDGATLSLALIRRPARDQDRRLGSLLFNFGGPGGSGVDGLPGFAPEYEKLNSRYDLVSFDPRGVARSSGVVCRSDREQEVAASRVDLTPDTPAEEAVYFEDAESFGAGCAARSGPVLAHVGTSDAARDMDLIRHVLGDRKLNYFGISYGTELGGTYAHLFPRNVGRTVLDAVVDPTADAIGHARNQTTGFQRALDNYLTSRGEEPAAGSQRIVGLLERIDARPLPAGDGRRLTESLALTGIAMSLYSTGLWDELTEGLAEAEQRGRGTKLLALADMYNDRDQKGRYDTQSHSQRAISCVDDRQRPTPAQAKALLPEFRRISPVFGEFLAWDTAGWCAKWPVPGERVTPEASAKGADPILVVGTTGDPATPYEGARRMADELGEGVGVLLTNKGEGHGGYSPHNRCVTELVDSYLLDGKVPEDGSTCG
ncbi:alpha/beta hydrolase [Streptomyces sp. FIT100]|uniref:alpha/beta hydrolase n=1 Tax=Streptomyces sp. FIT100 TaxID=2837956 RepID=UPI0021C6B2BB|nr:alpha/beta hydrolase [Streptomyces sp. FIT100]UUN29047.1 alpha/beta hydrolase [Streptomyces sp. FIT100]